MPTWLEARPNDRDSAQCDSDMIVWCVRGYAYVHGCVYASCVFYGVCVHACVCVRMCTNHETQLEMLRLAETY